MADETVTIDTPAPDTATPDWRAALPEELRGAPELGKYKSVEELAKGHLNQSKLVGARPQGVEIPTDKSTPEQRAAFYKALGVPETPDKYAIERPDVALDLGWDDALEATFKAEMHKLGATPAIVQKAVDVYGQMERARLEQARAEAQAAQAALRSEWGPNYNLHVGRANRAIKEFGGDALIGLFAENGMGRDPRVIKAFAAIGDALVEHGAMAGDGLTGVDPAQAGAKITELRAELMKHAPESDRAAAIRDEILALTRIIHRAA